LNDGPRPPGLARKLLEWALPEDVRDDILGDLEEVFRERRDGEGEVWDRLWYWREALVFCGRFLWEKLRERRKARRGVTEGPERMGRSARLGPGISWLDLKLAFRMLGRYPGLTIVSGLAMAFAIFVGAATFEISRQMIDPVLPLPDGDRIVGLRFWNLTPNEVSLTQPPDLRSWREELSTVLDLGAFESVDLNLAVGEGPGEPVQVARMSPVGFRVASVPPLMGRTLVEGDDDPGAPPVVVLGYRTWQARFGGDPAVIGRSVQLGDGSATVVGVMPEGYGFPRAADLWMPLPLEAFESGPSETLALHVFGRLGPGASLKGAQAEVANRVVATSGTAPDRYEHLTAEVLPYWESLFSVRIGWVLRLAFFQLNVFAALFLILVCGNIALLMFARVATRVREIVVRSALGASRGRIVGQLFVEALAIGVVAIAVALAALGPAQRWVLRVLQEVGGSFPFWVRADVSWATVVYASLLTLLGAVVAGVVPALKATGRKLSARLHQVGAGAGGLQFGGIWTALMVTQIAGTVVFCGFGCMVGSQAVRNASVKPYFPAEQYVGMQVEMDRVSVTPVGDTTEQGFWLQYFNRIRELEQRIAEDPRVAGVTLVRRLPVKAHGSRFIQLDGDEETPFGGDRVEHAVFSDVVDIDFFDVFQASVLSGRSFDSGSTEDGARPVVVNASFVEDVLRGQNAVGRRIRYPARSGGEGSGPWYEIVGVVQDLVADQTKRMGFESPPKARVFHPLDPSKAGTYPLYVVVHAPTGPATLVPTFFRAAEAVSPTLRVHEIEFLDHADGDVELIWRLFAYLVFLVSGVALFLSLAGIYAVTSFTVARRTREIGARVALGGRGASIVVAIFKRPLAQVATGIAVGCGLMALVVWAVNNGGFSLRDLPLILASGVGILTVCTLACIAPTLRALRVEPATALSVEE